MNAPAVIVLDIDKTNINLSATTPGYSAYVGTRPSGGRGRLHGRLSGGVGLPSVALRP